MHGVNKVFLIYEEKLGKTLGGRQGVPFKTQKWLTLLDKIYNLLAKTKILTIKGLVCVTDRHKVRKVRFYELKIVTKRIVIGSTMYSATYN